MISVEKTRLPYHNLEYLAVAVPNEPPNADRQEATDFPMWRRAAKNPKAHYLLRRTGHAELFTAVSPSIITDGLFATAPGARRRAPLSDYRTLRTRE